MSAAERNREEANELARRAIAAAERRRAEELGGEAVVERLREAADEQGRVSVDDALALLGDTTTRKPWNPFANAAPSDKDAAAHRLLFGEPEPEGDPPAETTPLTNPPEGEPTP